MPRIQTLVLRNCCQFKDDNLEYMLDKANALKHISLLGANLVSNDKWIDLFIRRSTALETLKLEWLDASFDDQAVAALVEFCPNLRRLKLERCRKLGVDAIEALARAKSLEHLTLQLSKEVPRERLVNTIVCLGPQLRTLSLARFLDSTQDHADDVLEAVHRCCGKLEKLRLTETDELSDAGFAALFTDWSNPPLRFVDLNSCRDVDNQNPDGPADAPMGLASDGFRALMAHSGAKLEVLDLSSCRHVSYATLLDVFGGDAQFPCLRELNVSFCPLVDTAVIAAVFKNCPALCKLVAFGCFQIADINVPRGIVLIGVPRAQDAIEQIGGEVQSKALL